MSRTVCVKRYKAGEVPAEGADGGEVLTREMVSHRVYTAGELQLLAALTGFKCLAWYGEMDASVPVDDGASRMVIVLQKAG